MGLADFVRRKPRHRPVAEQQVFLPALSVFCYAEDRFVFYLVYRLATCM
jgi:hypothetical protein